MDDGSENDVEDDGGGDVGGGMSSSSPRVTTQVPSNGPHRL